MSLVTIGYVASKKKIEQRYAEHFGRELQKVVLERFDDNQTRAAKALGVSQPHLSHLIAADGNRGPGLAVLILLREYTGRSIDDLLGLPGKAGEELTTRLQMTVDTEVARERRAAREMLEKATAMLAEADRRAERATPPTSKKKRA